VRLPHHVSPIVAFGVAGVLSFDFAQHPNFRTQVELVEVDVVAVDELERPVYDLQQSDFQVFENGKAREIVSYSRVDLSGSRPHPPPASDVYTNQPEEDSRIVFLLLDDVHTLREHSSAVRALASQFIGSVAPHDYVGVMWLSLGKEGAREFSMNHAATLQAVEGFRALDTRVRRLNPSEVGLPVFADPDDAATPEALRGATLDVPRQFERARVYQMVSDVCRLLAGVPQRRKAILYLGPASIGGQLDGGGLVDVDIDAIRAVSAAQRANVAVYVIDPAGSKGGIGRLPSAPSESISSQESFETPPRTLANLAVATGGFAASATVERAAIRRIVSDTSSYYLLGYYADQAATQSPGDVSEKIRGTTNGFRSIEVRTRRPGVTLRARKGYWPTGGDAAPSATRPDDAPADARAVRGILPLTDLGLRALAAPFKGDNGVDSDVDLVIQVSAPEFSDPSAAGGLADRLDLTILPVETNGTLRPAQRVSTDVGTRAPSGVRLPDGRYVVCARVRLSPGVYQLRVGAHSAYAGRTGSVYLDVRAPDYRAQDITLSGLALDRRSRASPVPVARGGALSGMIPFVPTLVREFTSADEVWAFARAYQSKTAGGSAVTFSAQVLPQDGHTPVWSAIERADPGSSVDRDGVAFGVRMPLEGLKPGEYRLRVTATVPGEAHSDYRELGFRMVPPPPATGSATRLRAPDRLPSVLALASAYVEDYLQRLSNVVADESYQQRLQARVSNGFADRVERSLRSEYLLVRVGAQATATPFRDVFEVDGTPVRDRDHRLQELFIQPRADSIDVARRILDEGARYNLGRVNRNINHPVLPLEFLLSANLAGFQIRYRGVEGVGTVPCWRLDYEETGRPTMIRQQNTGLNIAAAGSFWIDPDSGRILRTLLRTAGAGVSTETIVVYAFSGHAGILVPSEMQERYTTGGERVLGLAKYSNFRRFQVTTSERIK